MKESLFNYKFPHKQRQFLGTQDYINIQNNELNPSHKEHTNNATECVESGDQCHEVN